MKETTVRASPHQIRNKSPNYDVKHIFDNLKMVKSEEQVIKGQ